MTMQENFTFSNLLDFEKKSEIFLIHNNRGIYLWDIFRAEIFSEWYFNSLTEQNSTSKKTALRKVVKLFSFSNYLNTVKALFFLFFNKEKIDNFFYLATRNQYCGGFIDQNSYDVYQIMKGKKNLLFESFRDDQAEVKAYKEKFHFVKYYKAVVKAVYHPFLSNSDKNGLEKICTLVNNSFPERNLQAKELKKLLIAFYRDVFLYKHLFTNYSIKKVFLSQNGYQKGMFYIAAKLNVTVYEFQHGVIRKEHLAYSYPKIDTIKNYIHIPKVFLTFSSYWCSLFYCPINNVVLGNNYFSKEIVKQQNPTSILVISAFSFGSQLASFIYDAYKLNVFSGCSVVFKLHPHEYSAKELYETIFQGEIKILTDEHSVNELLSNAKCMITVNSTAAYEALQAKTKVLLYKISPYEQLEPLFGDRNVFSFSTTEELKQGMDALLPADYKPPVFFDKCTPEKIKAAIDE